MRGYTIYFSPLDYPGRYVLRGWYAYRDGRVEPDPEPTHIGGSLEACRRALPPVDFLTSSRP